MSLTQDLVLSQILNELQTTIFGVLHPSPILMAPIGVQCIFHPDAEFNPARAGKALKVPFILSTATSRTIEEVAEANGDGHRWFQLYWLVYSDKIFYSISLINDVYIYTGLGAMRSLCLYSNEPKRAVIKH
jgi:isopentenyl diphosphate isomerase/L-lactate dehydrogenase-like FMN-dependent dehydrogenase